MSEKDVLINLVKNGLTLTQYRTCLSTYPSLIVAHRDTFNSIPQLRKRYATVSISSTASEKCVTILDVDYPAGLLNLPNPPLVLWYEGDILLLNTPSLGVVGSRSILSYTTAILDDILPPLIQKNISIISGLAYGVDAYAHQLTVNFLGRAIGVLGGGLDVNSFYPKAQISLREKILDQGGLLLSEYPEGKKPTRYTFPLRNRIIAGLSTSLLVAQAAEKSGSLITAKIARSIQKKTFVCVGDYFEEAFSGNKKLLDLGAVPVTSQSTIARYYKLSIHSKRPRIVKHSVSLDEVITYFKIDRNELFSVLTNLEIEGRLQSNSDGTYNISNVFS